jgi:hypothetical protein
MDEQEKKELTDSIAYYKDELSKAVEARQHAKSERNELKEQNEKLQADIESYKHLEEKINSLSERLSKDSVKEELLSKHITESASKHEAFRPEQIPFLINKKGFMYDSDTKAFYKPIVDINGKEVSKQSLDEVVQEFLSNPDNDNLVKSRIKLGGPSYRGTVGAKSRGIDLSKIDEADIKKADEQGLEIKDYLEIKKLKLSKMGRRS